MQPWCMGIITLLLSALLPWPGTGEFLVLGPGAPLIAPVGKEAVLPCHLSPETDAEDMQVTWFRMDPLALVHRYATSQDHLEDQSPEYRGRTEFLKENINTGQVALRIFPTLPSDGGEYRCLFASSTFSNEAQFKVLVTASGTAPQIHIDPGDFGEMKLTCTSMGWYPKPEVQWTDLQGQHLTPYFETKTAAENGLLHVETSVTVNTKSRAVSCIIRNPVLSEEKEAQISLSDAVFPRLWPWVVGLTVPLCLLAVSITFCVHFVRTRSNQDSLQKQLDHLVEENVELTEELGWMVAVRRKALGGEGLDELRRFTEDITLDEDTAHPFLQLSEDKKYVRCVQKKQDVPDNLKRFDTHLAILGKNNFFAGDHYWEVDVEWKNRWEIGLCVNSVTRKGDISVCPENGFWALSLENNEYRALSTPPSILSVSEPPIVVGIFLQYEKGLISFYNVTDCKLVHTFKGIFTKPLKPYFYLGPRTMGNTAGLHITSIK